MGKHIFKAKQLKDGRFVKWTKKVQEAWDKQQPMELGEYYACGRCEYTCYNDYEEDYEYCPRCGQKIKNNQNNNVVISTFVEIDL